MKQWLLLPLLVSACALFAQPASDTRTKQGTPGPAYWQNQVHYTLNAELDDQKHLLLGRAEIEYINNSPHPLASIWFQLDQNAFKPEVKANNGKQADDRFAASETRGMEIGAVWLGKPSLSPLENIQIAGTRMEVHLPDTLSPHGGICRLTIDYTLELPTQGADRTGHGAIGDYYVYSVAQWYPRVAVFDDVSGWNTLPYLGRGEFYCEYGDFDYRITLPADYVVGGSGELVNAAELLRKKILTRLQSVGSEDIQYVIPEKEAGKKAVKGKEKATWHFRLENARDVSWACSKDFIWNATQAVLPDGSQVLCSAYFVPGLDEEWKLGPQHLKTSLEFYSRQWFPYRYSTMGLVSSTVGGIEYPAFTFVPSIREGNAFWRTTDHEVAHNWFPMMIGTNERKHFWMDEGLVTFMGYYAAQATGKYQSYMTNLSGMADNLAHTEACKSTTPPDAYTCEGYYDAMYFRPALGFILMRERLLGPERFDRALRSFMEAWAFKHPTPEDLYHHFNQASGGTLSWFWSDWFDSTKKLDQSVIFVEQKPGSPARITLMNRGELKFPVWVTVEYADQTAQDLQWPASIWEKSQEFTFDVESPKQVVRVVLDKEAMLPDAARWDNSYEVKK